ncbi:MAG: acyl-CoA dehydrogenase family protein [candidate division WOR-3 bacterium]|nr:MAG: acyl-CoA dehydrogenase family protein [candidate division WOR-3 bacterium]
MSIVFSNEQKLIHQEIRRFASAELNPIAGEIDKEAVFPGPIMKRLSDLGFLGILIPEEFSGAGLDAVSLCIILSQLARESASVGVAVAAHSCLVTYPILRYGTSECKRAQLPRLAGGEIGAFGSQIDLDAQCSDLQILKKNGSNVVDGSRMFVFNGETAQNFIVPIAHEGHLFHLIQRDSTVLTEPQYLLGLRAAGIVKARFKNTVLDGTAFSELPNTANALRDLYAFADIGFSAVALGIAEACFDAAIAYSKERKQFKKAICEFPMVREMLVDMKGNIEAARLLVFESAQLYDRNDDFILAAHIARLHACAASVEAGTASVQIHGGYGYTKDYPVERYLRDAKSLQVLMRAPYETKAVIAKELLV